MKRGIRWNDPEHRRNLLVFGSWKDKKARHVLIVAGALAFLVALSASYWTGVPFVTTPALCGQLCHTTYAEYQSWSKSSHSDVPCYKCHLDWPGQKDVDTVSRIFKTWSGRFSKPINVSGAYGMNYVPRERCLDCHTGGSAGAPIVKGVVHEKHQGAGVRCTVCHNRVAHKGSEQFEPIRSWKPGFKYPDFMMMRQGCWRCHSRDGKWRDRKALLMVEGMKPSTECDICHKSKWELMPREGRLDHRDVEGIAWVSGARHGREARLDYFACLGCHDKFKRPAGSGNPPDCSESCHGGIAVPHNTPQAAKYYMDNEGTPNWLETHPAEASERGVKKLDGGAVYDPDKICSLCHRKGKGSDNYCDTCHHGPYTDRKSGSPPVSLSSLMWRRQGHAIVVEERGAGTCKQCHKYEFCSRCHKKGGGNEI